MIRLVERDYLILKELNRWRICLSRHVQHLAKFEGIRATNRRLQKLLEAGYVERKHILYGVPYIYRLTHKGKMLIGVNKQKEKIKIEQIYHDVAVIDTAIYFMLKEGLQLNNLTTEKELNIKEGFNIRKHRPDFIYTKEDECYCVEVELTKKAKDRFESIIKDNFYKYEYQYWVVPSKELSIINSLNKNQSRYPNIKTLVLEEVIEYVRNIDTKS